jgi:hypothetical protein
MNTEHQSFYDGFAPLTFEEAHPVDEKKTPRQRIFESFERRNPLIARWWNENPSNAFARSLRENCLKWGNLTVPQLNKATERANEYDAWRSRHQAPTVDVSRIVAAFERAKQSGLAKVKMRLLGNDIPLLFYPAPRDAAAIYVKNANDDLYLGKIVDGVFMMSKACSKNEYAAVIVACASPEDSAVAYGRKFATCSCCGRLLTNQISVELGIGPICRGNFFG